MRRSVFQVLSTSLVFALLCARAASAQDTPGATVTTAAIGEVLTLLQTAERLPRGQIGLDSRVLEARPAPVSGAGAVTYVLGSVRQDGSIHGLLGAERVDFDSTVVCATDSPRSCTLPGVVAVFAASNPQLHASCAEVIVAARWRSALAKTPVGYARFAVYLEQSASGDWVARNVRTLFIS